MIDYIDEQNIDMVCIGSHGASGIREMFLGSNAQKIVRLSPVPTLVLKEELKEIDSPQMVFLSDFEPESKHLRLESLHPGVTIDTIRENSGFDIIIPDTFGESPTPSAEELTLLRDDIDPSGIVIGK